MQSSDQNIEIAIIGGTGIYEIEGSKLLAEKTIETPFGNTSSSFKIFEITGKKIAFLARHRESHSLLPSEIPFLANIYALKTLGVTHIIAISAVGSLQEKYPPQTIVIPDQIIDRTKNRTSTFFGKGLVGHLTFADPFSLNMNQAIFKAIASEKTNPINVHNGGTYICMEGPAFSTKAESNLYRSWGGDIIGMTAIPEAKLAREAEMDYSMVAMVTDYDAWHSSIESTSIEDIINNMKQNNQNIKKALPTIIGNVDTSIHESKDACQYSLITQKENVAPSIQKKLAPLYGKYWQ